MLFKLNNSSFLIDQKIIFSQLKFSWYRIVSDNLYNIEADFFYNIVEL